MTTETTRRALLGSVGLLATAASTGAVALATSDTEAGPSPDYQEGFLEGCHEIRLAVAIAWLDRFTKKGGGVTRQPDGSIMVGWSEYWDSRQHDADAERYGGVIPDHAIPMLRDRYEGGMRELVDQCETFPGLRPALKQIVGAHPSVSRTGRMS